MRAKICLLSILLGAAPLAAQDFELIERFGVSHGRQPVELPFSGAPINSAAAALKLFGIIREMRRSSLV